MGKIARRIPTQAQIDRMVKRIVKQFDPEQIILFGSQPRGDAGPDSDVDLLVVMGEEGNGLTGLLRQTGSIKAQKSSKEPGAKAGRHRAGAGKLSALRSCPKRANSF
jgi:hypothetical protein